MSRRKRKHQQAQRKRIYRLQNMHKDPHTQAQVANAVDRAWRRYQNAIIAHDLLCLFQYKVQIDDMCSARLIVLLGIEIERRDRALKVVMDYYMEAAA